MQIAERGEVLLVERRLIDESSELSRELEVGLTSTWLTLRLDNT